MTAEWHTTYWPETGEIIGPMHTDIECLPLNTPPGAAALPGEYRAATHYVANGLPVAYTPEQADAKARRPGIWHAWSNEAMAWVDLRPARQALDEQWMQVRARRARVFAATVDRVNPLWLEELTDEQRAELATFRRDLKDITDQADPSAIVWPTPPAWLAVSIPG